MKLSTDRVVGKGLETAWSSLDRGDLKLARSLEMTSAIVLANCTDSAIGLQPNEDDKERHIKFESFDLLSCIDVGNAEFI